MVYTPKDTPKYGYNKGNPMISHFNQNPTYMLINSILTSNKHL